MSRVRTAVFPAGGLGTRFLPATKALPKEMLPIVDKPLMQYAVEEAAASGIEQFVFVTSPGKSAIKEHFETNAELESTLADRDKTELLEAIRADHFPAGAMVEVQQEHPLGLGHAVWCAADEIQDDHFAVLLADDLIAGPIPGLSQLIDVHNEHGGSVIAVVEVPDDQTDRYGVISPGNRQGDVVEVLGLVEKPPRGTAPSNLAIVGRYVLDPAVLGHLASGETGAGGEIQLTDAMSRLVGSAPFHAVVIDGTRYDCGSKIGYLEATVALALERQDLGDVEEVFRRVLDAEGR
jgi:UTP--glucose-1-phosphate uridylyltransferase